MGNPSTESDAFNMEGKTLIKIEEIDDSYTSLENLAFVKEEEILIKFEEEEEEVEDSSSSFMKGIANGFVTSETVSEEWDLLQNENKNLTLREESTLSSTGKENSEQSQNEAYLSNEVENSTLNIEENNLCFGSGELQNHYVDEDEDLVRSAENDTFQKHRDYKNKTSDKSGEHDSFTNINEIPTVNIGSCSIVEDENMSVSSESGERCSYREGHEFAEEDLIKNQSTKSKTFKCCSISFVEEKAFIKHFRCCRYKRCIRVKLNDVIGTNSPPKTSTSKVKRKTRRKYLTLERERSFKCHLCKNSFHQKNQLQRHILWHTGEKPFECGVCKVRFSRKDSLQRHLRTHTGECPYQCDVCGNEFAHKHSLTSHYRVHTGEKPYKCDICCQRFSQRSSFVSHLRTHTEEKPYKCSFCEKTFSRRDILRRHLINSGEKPCICGICGKQFSLQSCLRYHIGTHTEEKPYKCDICEKRFILKNDLRRHIRIHTEEKPYKCEICGRRFNQKQNMRTHIRSHTGERPFKCNECGKGFAQKFGLKRHKRLHIRQRSC